MKIQTLMYVINVIIILELEQKKDLKFFIQFGNGDEYYKVTKPVYDNWDEELKRNEIEYKGIVGFDEENDRYKINSLQEKPKIKDAKSNIGILGRYILDYSIFDQIIDSESGETNLTDALSDSVNKSEISGKILEGYHFDTGNPQGLVKASNFFLKNSKVILENY